MDPEKESELYFREQTALNIKSATFLPFTLTHPSTQCPFPADTYTHV